MESGLWNVNGWRNMRASQISVVLTTKNRKYELRRALESVYGQTCMPEEIIVIDCSADDSIQRYIEGFSFPNLTYIRLESSIEQPHSVGRARNVGIRVSHGEYIAFLDSDDVWCKQRIEIAINSVCGRQVDILASQYRKHIRQEVRILPERNLINLNSLLESAWHQNLAVGSAAIYRKEFLEKIGFFNEKANYTADWEMTIRAAMLPEVRFEMIYEPLVDTWIMYDAVSMSDTAEMERNEMFSAFESEINEIENKKQEVLSETIQQLEREKRRKDSFYQTMRNWVELKLSGDSIVRRLRQMDIHTIIIYGAGRHGDMLFQDIFPSLIEVVGWIDAKSMEEEHFGLPVYRLNYDMIPTVDAIVITPYLEFENIKKELSDKTSARIISLKELVCYSLQCADRQYEKAGLKYSGQNVDLQKAVICNYIDTHVGSEDFSDILHKDDRYFVWENLSEHRQGVLRWYPFNSSGSVLEIGAGFGALTGALCDKLSRVVVTETDHLHAEYLAKRYSGRKNLIIYEDDITNITFEEKFDYIVLFGHFEIVANGKDEDELYIGYLQQLKALLKPQGIILLAVDNKYGIRLLCGSPDRYTNRPFEAIANYPNGTPGRLFTRRQLSAYIDRAGFSKKKFYSPLTDYRMPRVIYTDRMMPDATVGERLDAYYDSNSRQRMIVNDRMFYYDAAVNHAFHFLTNSYIVEITNEGKLCNADYVTISAYRGRNKAFAIIICSEDKCVLKKWLYPEAKQYAEYLCECVEALKMREIPVLEMQMGTDAIIMDYIDERTLQQHLVDLVELNASIHDFFAVFDQLWEYILKSSDYADQSSWDTDFENSGPILKNAFIELIPLNCFWINGSYLFFDQEFVFENIPAKYILFRGIDISLQYIVGMQQIISRQDFEERYGISCELWDYFKKKDTEFVDTVNPENLPWQPANEEEIRKNREMLL